MYIGGRSAGYVQKEQRVQRNLVVRAQGGDVAAVDAHMDRALAQSVP